MFVARTLRFCGRALLVVGASSGHVAAWLVAFNPLIMPMAASAQQVQSAPRITVDPSAPRNLQPNIGTSGAGKPVIGITTPNAGVSQNRLQDLIAPNGLIFNNSKTGGVSQTGGTVGANPSLSSSGPANVILTQVSGGQAALVAGAVEVFGTRADLIIANENGVQCVGCAFVNVGRATLTSGAATVTGDQITLNVRRGMVGIWGSGLSGATEAELVGREVVINGPVSANGQITASGGTQAYDYNQKTAKTAPVLTARQTPYAVDASALGAMSSGQIRIIGNESGMGVRLDSTLQAQGNVSVRALGDTSVKSITAGKQSSGAIKQTEGMISAGQGIDISGRSFENGPGTKLTTPGAITISVADYVNISGEVEGQSLTVTADKSVYNFGRVVAGSKLAFVAGEVITNSSNPGAARTYSEAWVTANVPWMQWYIQTNPTDWYSSYFRSLVGRSTIASSAGSSIAVALLQGYDVELTAKTGGISNTGAVTGVRNATLLAGTDIVNTGGAIKASAGTLTALAQGGIVNQAAAGGSNRASSACDFWQPCWTGSLTAGSLYGGTAVTLVAGSGIRNTASTISSPGNIWIEAGTKRAGDITNEGQEYRTTYNYYGGVAPNTAVGTEWWRNYDVGTWQSGKITSTGGNVSMVSRNGDITSRGADISATGTLAIYASGNVSSQNATTTTNTWSQNRDWYQNWYQTPVYTPYYYSSRYGRYLAGYTTSYVWNWNWGANVYAWAGSSSQSVGNSIAGGSVSMDVANVSLAATNVTSGSDTSISARQGTATLGSLVSARDTSVYSPGSLAITGTVSTARDLSIWGQANTNLGANLSAGRNANVWARYGQLDQNGNIWSGGATSAYSYADSINRGTITSGGNASIYSEYGSIVNAGVLSSSGDASLRAYYNIDNNNWLNARNLTAVATYGSLTNRNYIGAWGGQLYGYAGLQINNLAQVTTAARTSNCAFWSCYDTTGVTAAQMWGATNVTLLAGYNISNVGSLISSNGDVYAQAGRSGAATLANTGQDYHYTYSYYSGASYQVGTESWRYYDVAYWSPGSIKSNGGNVTLINSTGDVLNRGSNLYAGRDLTLSASGNVRVEDGYHQTALWSQDQKWSQNWYQVYYQQQHRALWWSWTTTESYWTWNWATSLTNGWSYTGTGNANSLVAGGNMNLQGSNVSIQNASLWAAADTNLTARTGAVWKDGTGYVSSGRDLNIYSWTHAQVGGPSYFGRDLNVTAQYGVADVSANTTTGRNVSVYGYSNVASRGNMTASGNATLYSEYGSLWNTAAIATGGNVNLRAYYNVDNNYAAAGSNLWATATYGSLNSSQYLGAGANAALYSYYDTNLAGSAVAGNNLSVYSEYGSVNNRGYLTGYGDVSLRAYYNIDNFYANAGRNLSTVAAFGNLTNRYYMAAQGGSLYGYAYGAITNDARRGTGYVAPSTLYGRDAVTLLAGYNASNNASSITSYGNITIEAGRVYAGASISNIGEEYRLQSSSAGGAAYGHEWTRYNDTAYWQPGTIQSYGGAVSLTSWQGDILNRGSNITAAGALSANAAGALRLEQVTQADYAAGWDRSWSTYWYSYTTGSWWWRQTNWAQAWTYADSSFAGWTNKTVGNTFTAGSDLTVSAASMQLNGATLKAPRDLTIVARTGELTGDNIATFQAGRDLTIQANTNLRLWGNLLFGRDVNLRANTGWADLNINVTAPRDISVYAYGDITNRKAITAGSNATLYSEYGSINNAGTVSASGNATLRAYYNIDNNYVYGTNASLQATYGSLATTSAYTANQLSLYSYYGLTNRYNAQSYNGNVSAWSNYGAINSSGAYLQALNGTLDARAYSDFDSYYANAKTTNLTALYGTLTNRGYAIAAGDLTAYGGAINSIGQTTAGNTLSITSNGWLGVNLAQAKTVNLRSATSDIVARGALLATTVNADAYGSLSVRGILANNITLTARTGSFTASGWTAADGADWQTGQTLFALQLSSDIGTGWVSQQDVIKKTGAIIYARNDLNIAANNGIYITNAATLASKNSLELKANGAIEIHSLVSGLDFKRSAVIADGDLTISGASLWNQGGTLSSKGNLIIATKGNVVNEGIQTYFAIGAANDCRGASCGRWASDWTAAEMLSGAGLIISAGGSIYNRGSNIGAAGSIALNAAGEIANEALTTKFANRDYANSYSYCSGSFLGICYARTNVNEREYAETAIVRQGTIQTEFGDLTLTSGAGYDIRNVGSLISAGGTVSIDSGRDLQLNATTVELQSVSYTNKQSTFLGFIPYKGGWANSDWNSFATVLASIEGNNVNLNAKRNISALGASAMALSDLTLTAGDSVTFDAKQNWLYKNQSGGSWGFFVSGFKLTQALASGGPSQAFRDYIGANPMLAAVHQLATAKDGWGSLNGSLSLLWGGASVLASANKASGSGLDFSLGRGLMEQFIPSDIKDAQGLYACATGGGGCSSLSLGVGFRYDVWQSRSQWTESHISVLGSGRDLLVSAVKDIALVGGTNVSAGRNMTLVAGQDLIIAAVADNARSSSSSWGASISVGFTGVTIGGNAAGSQSSSTTFRNANLTAGETISIITGRDASLLGAQVQGKNVYLDIGRDLIIASKQNTSSSSSWGLNASVTITWNGGIGGFSAGGSYASGNRQYTDSVTTITSDQMLDIHVGRTTMLMGAVLNGKQKLKLDTGNFVFDNYNDKDRYYSINASVGYNPQNAAHSWDGSIGGSYRNTTGVTYATVAGGHVDVTVRNKGDLDLSGLNRDINNVQRITGTTYFALQIPGLNLAKLADDLNAAKNYLTAATAAIPDNIRNQGKHATDLYQEALLSGMSGPQIQAYVGGAAFQQQLLKRRNYDELLKGGDLAPREAAAAALAIAQGERLFFDESDKTLKVLTDCSTHGYNRPCGVPVSELAAMTKERMLGILDQMISDLTAKNGKASLDDLINCAVAWRIQGGGNDGFDKIKAAITDSYDANIIKAANIYADAIVQSGASRTIKTLNRDGVNFGSELYDLAKNLKNDPDNGYSYIRGFVFRFAGSISGVDMFSNYAFVQLVQGLGFDKDLQIARDAYRNMSEDERIRTARAISTYYQLGAEAFSKLPKEDQILAEHALAGALGGSEAAVVGIGIGIYKGLSSALDNLPSGRVYSPRVMQGLLEDIYGKDNVKAETIAASGYNSSRVSVKTEIPDETGGSRTVWVPFNERGFPVFDDWSKATVKIEPTNSRANDLAAATRELRAFLGGGSRYNDYEFNGVQLRQITSGEGKISGFTWHHNEVTGIMQLVPEQLNQISHRGGYTVWGAGKK
jgi:filamentous hemagglutinin family protein